MDAGQPEPADVLPIWSQEIQLEASPVPRLPSGWASSVSRRTGEIYFLNLETGERTYNHPQSQHGSPLAPAISSTSPVSVRAASFAAAPAASPVAAGATAEASTVQAAPASPASFPAVALPSIFDVIAGVGVFLITRTSIKHGQRKGTLECYTVTVKATGELVLVAAREVGLNGFFGPPAPFRMFSEDIKPACRNGIVPDSHQPSYVGEMVTKSESRGKVFSLYRCQPHRGNLHEEVKELHAQIQVDYRNRARLPEPRKIQMQLHGEHQPTRILHNFCAERRYVFSVSTSPAVTAGLHVVSTACANTANVADRCGPKDDDNEARDVRQTRDLAQEFCPDLEGGDTFIAGFDEQS